MFVSREIKKIQHALVDFFPYHQRYDNNMTGTYGKHRKTFFRIGSSILIGHYYDLDRHSKNGGMIIYLHESNKWTGHIYGKKFTLSSTDEMYALLKHTYEICYLTHSNDRVITNLKEYVK